VGAKALRTTLMKLSPGAPLADCTSGQGQKGPDYLHGGGKDSLLRQDVVSG